MKWADVMPTEPGWYWWRTRDPHPFGSVRVYQVARMAGKLVVFVGKKPADLDAYHECYAPCLWAGPVPEPTEAA